MFPGKGFAMPFEHDRIAAPASRAASKAAVRPKREPGVSASTPQAAGYSATPLARKLGIHAASRVYVVGAPQEFPALLAPLPDGVVFQRRAGPTTDVAHVFAVDRADLARRLAALRKQLGPQAALWVSWPKKASRVPTSITEDVVRELALPLGWVDVKVRAIDAVWSGLKLVVRKSLR
jgi:hypothetical protein